MTTQHEIESIIKESGNSFHCAVTTFLKGKGWHTLVSPYYMDSVTGKPREIDLVAEHSWPHIDRFMGIHAALNIKLFIECKYISQPTVFWFGSKDQGSAYDWLVTHTPLKRDNTYTLQHHYLATNPEVAKLFSSKNKSGTESEPIYKALNQSLNAMVSLRGRGSIIPKDPNRRPLETRTVVLPVILCSSFSHFYRVEMDSAGPPKRIDDNFQLEVNYAYLNSQGHHMNEYFLLDVVDFKQLDDFLAVLENDKEAMFPLL